MVRDDNEERRSFAAYPIQRVREIAAAGNVNYLGTRVFRDIDNLGFTLEDVCRCLGSLEERHFRSSVRYPGRRHWMDEYLTCCTGRQQIPDTLYIKLKLDRDCVWIDLASFHRER